MSLLLHRTDQSISQEPVLTPAACCAASCMEEGEAP